MWAVPLPRMSALERSALALSLDGGTSLPAVTFSSSQQLLVPGTPLTLITKWWSALLSDFPSHVGSHRSLLNFFLPQFQEISGSLAILCVIKGGLEKSWGQVSALNYSGIFIMDIFAGFGWDLSWSSLVLPAVKGFCSGHIGHNIVHVYLVGCVFCVWDVLDSGWFSTVCWWNIGRGSVLAVWHFCHC